MQQKCQQSLEVDNNFLILLKSFFTLNKPTYQFISFRLLCVAHGCLESNINIIIIFYEEATLIKDDFQVGP